QPEQMRCGQREHHGRRHSPVAGVRLQGECVQVAGEQLAEETGGA
ncbi:MAG: hypothetical protein GX557_06210, partial [Chloroflexi bacterium]|nr:hypothetical protein [Chloroflexota bacterium]